MVEFNSIVSFTGLEAVNKKVILQLSEYLNEKENMEFENFFYSDTVIKGNHQVAIYSEKEIVLPEKIISNFHAIQILPGERFQESKQEFGPEGDFYLGKFYSCCNRLSLEILVNSDSYPQLLGNAVDFLIACSIIAYGSVERGSISFMSHANGFFTRFKDIEQIREKFENRYQNVIDLVRKSIEDGVSEKSKFQSYRMTMSRLYELKEAVYIGVKNGKLSFPEDNAKGNNPDMLYRSSFHSAISKNKDFLVYMKTDKQFLTSRLYTTFSYLVIKKLGVKNIDRYLLAYLIFRGVEDKYGVDAISLIKDFSVNNEGGN